MFPYSLCAHTAMSLPVVAFYPSYMHTCMHTYLHVGEESVLKENQEDEPWSSFSGKSSYLVKARKTLCSPTRLPAPRSHFLPAGKHGIPHSKTQLRVKEAFPGSPRKGVEGNPPLDWAAPGIQRSTNLCCEKPDGETLLEACLGHALSPNAWCFLR